MGTKGNIWGRFRDNKLYVGVYGKEVREIDVSKQCDDFSGHGGGDIKMVEDYLDVLEGKPMPSAMTTIARSVESHYICLAAEESRVKGGELVRMDEFSAR